MISPSTTARWRVLAAIVGLSCVGAPAWADGGSARALEDQPIAVREVIDQPTAGACRYRATVRGHVVRRIANGDVTATLVRYDPDLRVRSGVFCPRGRNLEWERRVHGSALDPSELVSRVAHGGAIVSGASGRRCLYAPSLQWDGGSFTPVWLKRECGRRASLR